MLIGVNPGIVFISLSTRPFSVAKKSTRENPLHPIAMNAFFAVSRSSSVISGDIFAGISRTEVPSLYFAS